MVDAGAERLTLSWINTRKRLIRRRDGIKTQDVEDLKPDFADLLFDAGLPLFVGKQWSGVRETEFLWLSEDIAPYESDGPGDEQSWNIFQGHLDDRPESLNNVDELSSMLTHWQVDMVSIPGNSQSSKPGLKYILQEAAMAEVEGGDDQKVSDEQRLATQRRRDELGRKAVRALQRMSVIPTPNH